MTHRTAMWRLVVTVCAGMLSVGGGAWAQFVRPPLPPIARPPEPDWEQVLGIDVNEGVQEILDLGRRTLSSVQVDDDGVRSFETVLAPMCDRLREVLAGKEPREVALQLVYVFMAPRTERLAEVGGVVMVGYAIEGVGLEEKEVVAAVLPHLESPRVGTKVRQFLSIVVENRPHRVGNPEWEDMALARWPTRSRASLYLRLLDDRDVPGMLVRRVFRHPPDAEKIFETLRAEAQDEVYDAARGLPGVARGEARRELAEVEWARRLCRAQSELELAERAAREAGDSEGNRLPRPESNAAFDAAVVGWKLLAGHEHWWARAYAASYLASEGGRSDWEEAAPETAEKLKADPDPRVRAVANPPADERW